MADAIPYRRILIKLSGESIMGSQKSGVCSKTCQKIALAIKTLQQSGIQICLVIGGGNIFRGIQGNSLGIERTPSDQMGMLATIINGIALEQTLHSVGCSAKVLTALECPQVAETYTWRNAEKYLQDGNILIFVGGTSHPYFTTDTAAALRASELKVDLLLKATKVNGIYNKDPLKYSDASMYHEISYSQVLAEKLEVMDATSIALCMSNHLPIFVFNMEYFEKNTIVNVLLEKKGTIVK